jgi:hypothetical protein
LPGAPSPPRRNRQRGRSAGRFADAFYIVRSARSTIEEDVDGTERVLQTLGAGESLAYAMQTGRAALPRARPPCEVSDRMATFDRLRITSRGVRDFTSPGPAPGVRHQAERAPRT